MYTFGDKMVPQCWECRTFLVPGIETTCDFGDLVSAKISHNCVLIFFCLLWLASYAI